jgi:hypothetical protein
MQVLKDLKYVTYKFTFHICSSIQEKNLEALVSERPSYVYLILRFFI